MLRGLFPGLCALALSSGCALEQERADCRDPGDISFFVESRISSCGDNEYIERDLGSCARVAGKFDETTCAAAASYTCSGVTGSTVYTFPAGELARGVAIYRRIEDPCRVELTLVELTK